jgi:hypothetical protein
MSRDITHHNYDRVRENTFDFQNQEIDDEILDNINFYSGQSNEEITARIEELEQEWDMERVLEINAAGFSTAGLLLGTFVNKKWLILPGVVAFFLGQHAVQGWCPPLEVLRAMKFRTRKEIAKEKFALKVVRGDFKNISNSQAEELLDAVEK